MVVSWFDACIEKIFELTLTTFEILTQIQALAKQKYEARNKLIEKKASKMPKMNNNLIQYFVWRWELQWGRSGHAFSLEINYLDGLFDFGSPNLTHRVHLFMLKPIGQVKEVSWLYGFWSNLLLTGFILEMWIDLRGPWTWFERNGQILEGFGGSRKIGTMVWIRKFLISIKL